MGVMGRETSLDYSLAGTALHSHRVKRAPLTAFTFLADKRNTPTSRSNQK